MDSSYKDDLFILKVHKVNGIQPIRMIYLR